MNGTKKWWLSNSVRAGIASIVVWVMSWAFNIEIDKATVVELLAHIIGPIVNVWGVWARAVATEKIKWKD